MTQKGTLRVGTCLQSHRCLRFEVWKILQISNNTSSLFSVETTYWFMENGLVHQVHACCQHMFRLTFPAGIQTNSVIYCTNVHWLTLNKFTLSWCLVQITAIHHYHLWWQNTCHPSTGTINKHTDLFVCSTIWPSLILSFTTRVRCGYIRTCLRYSHLLFFADRKHEGMLIPLEKFGEKPGSRERFQSIIISLL